ncbi:uncharacterized protein LOC133180694 [Saccostrea echinata]|uniref:uncharacterized protein LOC133180694 n=1 Tax=Saccostrea echinata TaxID=191078 RepID=UPI002A7F0C4E|nr:uncharacterized protein LOC133180694 [Saccostrea echinata]
MWTKAEKLKYLANSVVCDVKTRHKGFIQRLHQQIRKMKRHLVSVENYEHTSEQSENRAVKFLLFIKKTRVPKMKDTPNLKHPSLLSLTEEINREDVIKLLTEIQIIETGKRQVRNECLLKLMSTPVLHTTVKLTGVSRVRHISCVTSERVWITDGVNSNVILTNITGDTLHQLTDIASYIWNYGAHTVDITGDLIYIDRDYNINKLSKDNRTKSTLIKKTEQLEPHCVYCSPSNGDLMVVMYNTYTKTAFVNRYNNTGEHTQTIQYDNTRQKLYRLPNYITENCNGDIVVSDYDRAVVVTDHGGRHRFSYTGPPSGSGLRPRGICTDALLNILVCDVNTHTVQMIDKDGRFLSLILTPKQGINRPQGLYYDVKSHLLWVGSWNKSGLLCVLPVVRKAQWWIQQRCIFNRVWSTVCPPCREKGSVVDPAEVYLQQSLVYCVSSMS